MKPMDDKQLNLKYGMLYSFVKIYGIEGPKRIRVSCRILRYLCSALIYVLPIYLIITCTVTYMNKEIYLENLIGTITFDSFSIALHRSIASKKYSLLNLMVQYDKISASIGMVRITHRKVMNAIIMVFVLIWILVATLYSIALESYPEIKRIFSFYIVCDNYIGIFISFVGSFIQIAYTYGFPFMVTMMCGIFYYEFAKILSGFRARLENPNTNCNASKMLCDLAIHRELYKLSYTLQDALSLICFFLLCSQMAGMYYLLSVFVLTKTEDIVIWQIIDFTLIIVFIPLNLIGVIWCASRIDAQHQRIQTSIHLLLDSDANLRNLDANIITYLKRMKEKQFPVMSACGILKLKPKLLFGFFGSVFTYGMLFLNLKR